MATVTPTQSISSSPLPPPDEVYRLTVEQFDRMVRSGTLDEDEPVELHERDTGHEDAEESTPPRRDEKNGSGLGGRCFPPAGSSRRKNRS